METVKYISNFFIIKKKNLENTIKENIVPIVEQNKIQIAPREYVFVSEVGNSKLYIKDTNTNQLLKFDINKDGNMSYTYNKDGDLIISINNNQYRMKK